MVDNNLGSDHSISRSGGHGFNIGLFQPIPLTLFAIVLSSTFFWLYPEVDLGVSGLFYRAGDGFFLSHSMMLIAIRKVGVALTWVFGAGAIGLMLAGIFTAGWRSPLLRSGAFLTSVLLLGPGLIVNVILKSHWGRARPDDIVNFGGQLSYSKVWVIAHECSRNCSFVSGEGAASFALLAISFIVPSAYRRRVAFAALLVALVISTCRIMFGGHFLSDTLLSWLIVLLVILVLDRYINRGPWIAAPTISDTLSPSGRR